MKTLKQLLAAVEKLRKADKHDKVIATLTDEVLTAHNNGRLYENLGLAWYGKKEFEPALAAIQKAVELTDDADAYFWRGEVYLHLDELEKSFADFDMAIAKKDTLALAEDFGFILGRRAFLHYKLGRHKEALKEFNQAIKLKPGESLFLYHRGCLYMDQEKYDKAIADFDAAITIAPEDAAIYVDRAVCYGGKGDNKKAMEDLNKAISLEPENGLAYANRAVIWSELGEHQRALRDANKGVELEPEVAHRYFVRGEIWDHMKDYKNALADFDKALELDPDHEGAKEERTAVKRKTMAGSWR